MLTQNEGMPVELLATWGEIEKLRERVASLTDQRDEALQALAMLCEHHYTYAGADADTANDHGLYAKVKTARAALRAITSAPVAHCEEPK